MFSAGVQPFFVDVDAIGTARRNDPISDSQAGLPTESTDRGAVVSSTSALNAHSTTPDEIDEFAPSSVEVQFAKQVPSASVAIDDLFGPVETEEIEEFSTPGALSFDAVTAFLEASRSSSAKPNCPNDPKGTRGTACVEQFVYVLSAFLLPYTLVQTFCRVTNTATRRQAFGRPTEMTATINAFPS